MTSFKRTHMMQQAIQQGGDGRGVAESFAPVVNGPV